MFISLTQTRSCLLPLSLLFSAVAAIHAAEPGTAPASTAPVLVGIRVNGPNTILAGQSAQLTAVGTYSDQSTKDITGTASWSVLQKSVAALTLGVVQGIQPGVIHAEASVGSVRTALPIIIGTNHLTQVAPSMSPAEIQGLINNSAPGDVLYFNTGVYHLDAGSQATLNLLPGRTYVGSLNGPAILSGTGGYALMKFAGNGVVVQNFVFDGGGISLNGPVSGVNLEYNTFQNIGTGYANWTTTDAVFMDTSAANSDFSYNKFSNIGTGVLDQFVDVQNSAGIFGYGLSNVTIEHNTFDTFNEGIHIFYDRLDGSNVKIEYNTFNKGHRIAIEQQDAKAVGLEIAYNIVQNPLNGWALTYGLSVATPQTDGVLVHDNIVNANNAVPSACTGSGCHYGYGIEAWGDNMRVYNNVVEGWWANGVGIGYANSLQVVNNTICGPAMAQTNNYIGYEYNPQPGTVIQGNAVSPAMTCGGQ